LYCWWYDGWIVGKERWLYAPRGVAAGLAPRPHRQRPTDIVFGSSKLPDD
jgi:hypothetical protein